MAVILLKCFNCGTELSFSSIPGRREECTKCGADVHVCRNCQHYDRSAYNECRETSADVVREKDRANFCDFFAPGSGTGPGADKKKDMLAAAEALFKKKT
jgi:ribosome-binding protein aMBF1 (putative translation factor)